MPVLSRFYREWTEINKTDLLQIWETQEFKSLSPLE